MAVTASAVTSATIHLHAVRPNVLDTSRHASRREFRPMAGFNLLDWLFGRSASARAIQSQNVTPFTRINSQPVAPEKDTILSDGYAPPYRADDLDDFGCETDAMRQAYLRLFREEPSLKSAVEGKAESIASLDVMVKPCDESKPNDVRAAKFVEWSIKATAHGFDGLFLNVLKPAFLLGWSCQEIVLRHVDPDESAEWGGFVGLRHCRSLNTAKLRLHLDAYRNVLGVVNTVRGLGTYPRRKVLLYTHNELFHNPFGGADAATAYRDASVIDAAFKLWGFALKVYGGPFLKGTYSAKDTRKMMERALDAARQGGWITLPKGDDVEVINLATATSFAAFQEKVKKHEERVYTAVRGAYLPYMQGNSQGAESRGSAETAKSAGSDPKEYLVGVSVCRAINRDVVPHLVTPNFPAGTGMPEVVLGGVNWGETKVQLDVAKALKELGHEVEEEYLSKVTGMPIKPKAVQGSGVTLPGAGLGGGPGAGPGGPPTGDGGAGSGGPSGPSGTPVEPTNNLAPTPAGQTQRPAAQTSDPTPAPPQAPAPAPAQAPAPNDSAVPAELLAAMTRAAEAGDWPAVQRLVNLGRHPEELEVLLGVAAADNATFAEWSPHTLADGSSGWKSSGGLIRKTKPKGADDKSDDTSAGGDGTDKPAAPKRNVIAEAKSAKAAREPARQAARDAWAAVAADPSSVRAEHLPELANHLRSLTRDELRGMNQALGRSGSGLKEDVVQRLLSHVGANVTPAPAAPTTRDDGTPVAPVKHDVYTVKPSALKTDPGRFQYKVSGIKAGGVSDELKGTSTWNPELGGTLLAWRDPATGEDFVVNGHHRHELASRVGAEAVNVRYIDAPTAREARARGALANIAEGRGTATDAAKYLRDSGQDVDHLRRAGISMSGKVAADAANLKDLSDGAFQRLTTGDLDEAKAVAVARHLKDPKLQDALFKKLDAREADGKDWSNREVETAARKMARAGSVTERGQDLFGGFEDEKSTFDQEVELESHIGRALQQAANDYAAVANTGRAERVKGAGNVLAVDENQKRRQAAAGMVQDFERESGLKSPVSDAIQKAAAELAVAKTKREKDAVKQQAVETVRGILGGGQPAPADAGRGVAGGAGAPGGDRSGSAGRPPDQPATATANRDPQEGDRNADGLILRDGRWRREGEGNAPAATTPATPAELRSLTNYTLASTAINTPLREGSLPVGGEERQAVEHLDRLADAGRTSSPLTVFRGADSDEIAAITRQLGVSLDSPQAVGRSFTDAGFVSAGRDREKINERFGPGSGDDSRSLVRIEVPPGVPSIDVGSHGGGAWAKETEHVLGRGLTYTVTGRDANGTVVVRAGVAGAPAAATPAAGTTSPTPATPSPSPSGPPLIQPGSPGWNVAGNTIHPTREAAESALASMTDKAEVRDYGVMPGPKPNTWFVASRVNPEKVAARDAARKAEFDKPSTTNVGRELIDGNSFSHLVGADANKLSTVRAAANVEPNGTPHPLLGQVAHQAGFTAPPKVVNATEMDELSRAGWKVGYRGVASDDQHELFRSGPYWAGRGLAGAGTYVAMPMADGGADAGQLAKERAESFGPAVARFAVAPDARIGNQVDIDKQRRTDIDALKKELRDGKITKPEFDAASAAIADTGVYAAMKGYDGYHVGGDPATEGVEARQAAKAQGADYLVVLNRGKVAVEGAASPAGAATPPGQNPATAADNPVTADNTTPVPPRPAGGVRNNAIASETGSQMPHQMTRDEYEARETAIPKVYGEWNSEMRDDRYSKNVSQTDKIFEKVVRQKMAEATPGGDWPFPPVVIKRESGPYDLKDGHHRIEVAKRLGMRVIPATLVDQKAFGHTRPVNTFVEIDGDGRPKVIQPDNENLPPIKVKVPQSKPSKRKPDHAMDHRKSVEAALKAGIPVSAEVLADYPDLNGAAKTLLQNPASPTDAFRST